MAFYRGQQGSVKFDDAGSSPAAIASTTAWSLTLEKETLDTTALGATARSNVGGLISGSGSFELIYAATAADDASTTAASRTWVQQSDVAAADAA